MVAVSVLTWKDMCIDSDPPEGWRWSMHSHASRIHDVKETCGSMRSEKVQTNGPR
jgi:hypothetical protein